ncbi:hypothetical protein JCM10212_005725 [Sporobolomyces blumeae]
MQSSSRHLLRTSLLRASARPSPSSTPSSFATASTSASSASSAAWTPSTRFPTSYTRTFTYSAQAWAKEAGGSPFDDQQYAQHVPLFERIQQAPEVIDAVENMAKLVAKKTGVDLQAGDKPSMSMMLQLARDEELRSAAERLMAALRGAGIEVNPQEAFKALQMMGGEGFGGRVRDLAGLHERANKGDGGEDGEGNGKK